MILEQLLLVDHSGQLVSAWREVFEEFDFVESKVADFFSVLADTMVSPANTFAIMDGEHRPRDSRQARPSVQ